ncbi:hypothetical protein PMAC_003422 [Pneumocystis sp. 'macacae']|nr:hypothetical protein PMAC_003422 [Pneumocystis sp. 'macacae']
MRKSKNEFTKNCTAFEAKLTNLHFPSYDQSKCEEKLKEVCVELSNICIVLKKGSKRKMRLIEKEIKLISEKILLKNCNNQIKSDCDELKNRCEKQGLIYSIPGSEFNPMRLDITLVEK